MPKHSYKIGDTVFLRRGPLRNAEPQGAGRVLAVLPSAADGMSQYRVKFDTENCERHINAAEIDDDVSVGAEQNRAKASTGSWINTKAIKINK